MALARRSLPSGNASTRCIGTFHWDALGAEVGAMRCGLSWTERRHAKFKSRQTARTKGCSGHIVITIGCMIGQLVPCFRRWVNGLGGYSLVNAAGLGYICWRCLKMFLWMSSMAEVASLSRRLRDIFGLGLSG